MDASEEKMETRARIVIVGGGFGGLFTALGLAGAGQVTLVSNEEHFLHTPLLYEYLSGEVEAWHIAPPYRELLGEGVRFVQGAATDVDLDRKEVTVAGRLRRFAYDYLVLAVGGVTNFWGVEGAEAYTLPFRKIRHADDLRRRMIEALDHIPPDAAPQDARRAATFVIVGGGASGVELSTKMSDLLRDAFRRRGLRGEPRVVLVEMGRQLVPGMGDDLRAAIEKVLEEKRVETYTETRVVKVEAGGVTFEHAGGRQTTIESAGTIWTAGVRVNPLVEKLDVEKTRHGLLVVAPTLQVRGRPEVFALGDIAHFPDVPPRLAGTAQLAYQQSRAVARNVQALIDGSAPSAGHFEELGEAVSLGTDEAAVLVEGRVVGGQLARQARFALYTLRLPTWHQRLRVGAAWFFGGKAPRPLGL